jgi:hypothetical protein
LNSSLLLLAPQIFRPSYGPDPCKKNLFLLASQQWLAANKLWLEKKKYRNFGPISITKAGKGKVFTFGGLAF